MSFINNLNNADFLVMLLILLAMLRGYLRGFVKEFLSIFSIFFSGYIAIYFYPSISLFIKKYIEMGVISDIISLSILFFFIYSCFGTVIRFITKKINNTSLEIFDKNFGIIFGFIKAMIILSIINILLVITLWKENYPSWINESKSLNLIKYSSNVILKIIPSNTMVQLKEIFKIDIPKNFNNGSKDFKAEQYGEPDLNENKYKKKEGYSNNDNESLNKLFNIENND
ncbi:MAG: hypothetical protein CMJ08_01390 [Pelagibacterales bacterium]|nr:hypothetical protein [Pelagibacterales bacterium]